MTHHIIRIIAKIQVLISCTNIVYLVSTILNISKEILKILNISNETAIQLQILVKDQILVIRSPAIMHAAGRGLENAGCGPTPLGQHDYGAQTKLTSSI